MQIRKFILCISIAFIQLNIVAQDSVEVFRRYSISSNLPVGWAFTDRLKFEKRHNSDALSFCASHFQTAFNGWLGAAEYRRYLNKKVPSRGEFYGYFNGGIAWCSYYDSEVDTSYAAGTVSFITLGVGERINFGNQKRLFIEGNLGFRVLNAGFNAGRSDPSGPSAPIDFRINMGFQFYGSKKEPENVQSSYKMHERNASVSISCNQPLGFVSKARIKIEYKWKRNAFLLDMSGHYLQATGVQSYLEFRKYLVDFDVRVQNFMYWKGGWGRTKIWDFETGAEHWPVTNYYLAGFGVGRRVYAERNERFFAEGTIGVKYAYAPGAPKLDGNGVMFRVVGPGSFVDLNFQIGYCIAGK